MVKSNCLTLVMVFAVDFYRALKKWGSEDAIKLRRLIIKREMDRKGQLSVLIHGLELCF